MTILFLLLSVTCAAFCIWLTVRIVNRRERWAKWTLAAVLSLPLLYVASFGPACRMMEEGRLSINSPRWRIYHPLARLASSTQPSFARDLVCRWVSVCDGDIGLAVLAYTLDPD